MAQCAECGFWDSLHDKTCIVGQALSENSFLKAERQLAILALREICAAVGDNDWPDSLFLADILEKHLADHLLESGGLVDRFTELSAAAVEYVDFMENNPSATLGEIVNNYLKFKHLVKAIGSQNEKKR